MQSSPLLTSAAEIFMQIRRTDVRVHVQDSNGNPVPNANVQVDQTKQAFPFGVAINYQLPANTQYQNWVKQRFNWVVYENEAKWYHTEPFAQGQYNYGYARFPCLTIHCFVTAQVVSQLEVLNTTLLNAKQGWYFEAPSFEAHKVSSLTVCLQKSSTTMVKVLRLN